jgi:hypothetical protein
MNDLALWMFGVVIVCCALIVTMWTPVLISRWYERRRARDLRVRMTTKRVAEMYDQELH